MPEPRAQLMPEEARPMSINAFQRHGDPVGVGWKIGHAPLWLRGIRCAEGDGAAPPAAPPVAPAAPAPNPAQVAAFYAAQQGTQAPAASPSPTPQAPTQVVQGIAPEQMQKLIDDAVAKAAGDHNAALVKVQEERDTALAQIAEQARTSAITTAVDGKANAALLLDSAKFQAAIKDLDISDTAKLGATVEQFVKDNPAYAATPATPQLPGTSGTAPTGGATTKPTTLAGALAAAMGD